MHIDIISCVPKLLESPFQHSILKRAQTKGLAMVMVHDLREYSTDKHHKIDDYAFGGEAGMLINSKANALMTKLFISPPMASDITSQSPINYHSKPIFCCFAGIIRA
jgi:tRNA (guanine-N1)-methyltransferase